MKKENEEIVKAIENKITQDDFEYFAYELLKDKREKIEFKEIIPELIKIIEKYSEQYEIGSPGPLVHFIESFGAGTYEEILIHSIEKQPTPLSTWMLNRIINAENGKEKLRYIKIMEEIINNRKSSQITKDEAKQFIEFQYKNKKEKK